MNIYQRCNAVRKKIGYVQKDATVQSYRAVSHDMVTANLRDHLIEQGVMVIPTQVEGTMHEAGQTKSGAPIYRYEAIYQVAFVNADDPSDRFEITLAAHANDSGDKAPGKACSYAVKYALLKVFSLETGENEESRLEGSRKEEKMLAHIKEEMTEFLEHKDSLGIYLLSQSVGQDVWTDVYNSAPDGQKAKLKKTLRAAESEGADVYAEINQAILTDDAGQAAENIADILPATKRLLAQKLGHDKSIALGNMMSRIEQTN